MTFKPNTKIGKLKCQHKSYQVWIKTEFQVNFKEFLDMGVTFADLSNYILSPQVRMYIMIKAIFKLLNPNIDA